MTEIIILKGCLHIVSECISCGVVYTCPEVVWNKQREQGGFHTCPNGHSQGWNKGDTEQDKIRRERDKLRQQIAQKDDELAEKALALEAATAKAAKAKKRAANGVCPCCNRTVSQLARHMKSKHPKFVAEATH